MTFCDKIGQNTGLILRAGVKLLLENLKNYTRDTEG